jgi:dienelactone hydrolase
MASRIAYVSFETPKAPALRVAGKLSLPAQVSGPLAGAAVVICHGSDGVDGRGEFHAAALHKAGIATLEIDMWAARGTVRGAGARPASPVETMPDAFGALRFLGAQPEINPARVGIMGFSWGGVVSLLAATLRHADALRGPAPAFAAHAALYPVCWAYSRVVDLELTDRTPAPILIHTGEADDYDTPGAGERLVAALNAQVTGGAVQGVVHPGATHGFDRDLPGQIIHDPFAHEGAGGAVSMVFDPVAAQSARKKISKFFGRVLRD